MTTDLRVNTAKQGMVTQAFNPSTEAGGSLWVRGQPGLQSKSRDSQGSVKQRTPASKQTNKQTRILLIPAPCPPSWASVRRAVGEKGRVPSKFYFFLQYNLKRRKACLLFSSHPLLCPPQLYLCRYSLWVIHRSCTLFEVSISYEDYHLRSRHPCFLFSSWGSGVQERKRNRSQRDTWATSFTHCQLPCHHKLESLTATGTFPGTGSSGFSYKR